MKKIIVEGHRGYCAKYPENTMISFEAAMDFGVDAIEFDVWLTSDKVPVLLHDGNCRRTCGENVHVRDLTLEEVKKISAHYEEKFGDQYKNQGITIPTLEELLQSCTKKRPDLWLGVEIKEYTEETVDITVSLLKEYGIFVRLINAFAKEQQILIDDIEMEMSDTTQTNKMAAVFTLRLPTKSNHTELIEQISALEGVIYAEEI